MKISIINKPEIKQRNQAESEHIVQFGYNTGIMTEVMNAFEQNTTLKTLNMSDQIIPYPEYIPALQFANLIRNNTTIISLDISHVAYKVRDEVMNALAKNNTLRSISLSANLEIEANQEALSKNYNLMTIRCFTGFNQQLSPYALEMQARNRNFFTGTSLLMLYAMSGERTHYGTEKCDKVIGDINLLTYIASFYMHPNLAKKIHSSICSFFKRKSTDELESEGQNIKKQRVDAPQSSAQI